MPVDSGRVNLSIIASEGSIGAQARAEARIKERLALYGEGWLGMTRDESLKWKRDWSVLGGVEYRW
jgi:hypothetical protein